MVSTMTTVLYKTHNLFDPNELEEGGLSTTNHNVGVMDILSRMHEVSALFKVLTNFKICEFDELATLVCSTIRNNAHNMGIARVMSSRPMKLTHEQHLLNFVMYLKHDDEINYESFQWNVTPTTLCNNVIFIA